VGEGTTPIPRPHPIGSLTNTFVCGLAGGKMTKSQNFGTDCIIPKRFRVFIENLLVSKLSILPD
jgi:hypothetical protein